VDQKKKRMIKTSTASLLNVGLNPVDVARSGFDRLYDSYGLNEKKEMPLLYTLILLFFAAAHCITGPCVMWNGNPRDGTFCSTTCGSFMFVCSGGTRLPDQPLAPGTVCYDPIDAGDAIVRAGYRLRVLGMSASGA
jgi:hypothetical protein